MLSHCGASFILVFCKSDIDSKISLHAKTPKMDITILNLDVSFRNLMKNSVSPTNKQIVDF